MKMKKYLILLFFSALLTGAVLLFYGQLTVKAQNEKITYPIAELGSCKSKADCKSYCDKLENISVCVDFAKNRGMISEDEATRAKKLGSLKGPGGCNTKETCEAFCDNTDHIEECVVFAEQNNLMSQSELAEAKKVAGALKQGAKTPGGCKGKQQCDAYCQEPAHMEVCLDFAEKTGMISQEELQQARKMLPLMQRGEMPGNCRNKEQCESYCQEESHFEECVIFSEKAGMMSKEEAARAKKTKGKGPGGCKSKETCDAFCNNPDNQETCINFAKENGLIPEEDLKRMEEGVTRLKNDLQKALPEVKECFKEKLGADVLEKIINGKYMPGPEFGNQAGICFEQSRPKDQQGMPGNGSRGGIPAEAMGCVKQIYGEEFIQKMEKGEEPPPSDMGQRIGECMKQNMPQPQQQNQNMGEPPPGQEYNRPPEGQGLPPGYQPGDQMPPTDGQQTPPNYQQFPNQQLPPQEQMPPQNQQAPMPQQEQQPQQTMQPPPPPPSPDAGQVRGANTSRLPGFIRWLLGY